ncbi:MAG TPA: hypothetical protein VFC16_15810 [Nakamurella sp.]|nr:hypothetical protein [Nakamurella sp.]
MELLDGQSPPQFIRRQGRLPPGQAATIGVAVVSALFAAHAVGITHRDLIFGRVMTPTNHQGPHRASAAPVAPAVNCSATPPVAPHPRAVVVP